MSEVIECRFGKIPEALVDTVLHGTDEPTLSAILRASLSDASLPEAVGPDLARLPTPRGGDF